MGDVDFTIEGLPELAAAMQGLPGHIRREALVPAIETAGQIVLSAVQARAPVRTGGLQRALAFQATQIGGDPSGFVAPKITRGRGAGGAHGQLVEFGTAPHASKYYGHPARHPGTAPRPFFWPGVEAVSDLAIGILESAMGDAADAYWAAQGGAD